MMQFRPAASRGHAQLDWLDSWHSFSFGQYYNPDEMGFGALRVINEDRVDPAAGFPPHSHQDMEILTYVLEGGLRHRDSTGGTGVLRPGEMQVMSAGRGITHSEMNDSRVDPVHFLQIWVVPGPRGLTPGYRQQPLDASAVRAGWQKVAAPADENAQFVLHQDARLWIGWPAAGSAWRQPLAPERAYYLHVARGRVQVGTHTLQSGDALGLKGEALLETVAGTDSELLLFDLA
ncbi:pirin family protein [Flagellatimonas centrodinii]|uniref:pirin family protein n=1 Tax=Flagellatimonas centrodinii TaxID=2806210 RepID=UPI001FEF9879|nr:pirin family protein [Flagellatimonas centrodinii]ULQ45129.1 pirin family protein [Flagellatimonas centrodinii]